MKPKAKLESQNEKLMLGIAWYDDEKSFIAMKEFSSDKEIWEETYDEWLKFAIEKETEIKRAGLDPIRVKITVDGLSEFCNKNGKRPDANTRANYISFLLEYTCLA